MWDDCTALEASTSTKLDDRTDEQWEEAFAEHGILHFVEFMEGADPLMGQLTYVIVPALVATYYYYANANLRKPLINLYGTGSDGDYYSFAEIVLGKASPTDTVKVNWREGWQVKVFGSASLMAVLALFELVNIFVKLSPEIVFMVWGITAMLIGVLDLTYFAMGATTGKRMYDKFAALDYMSSGGVNVQMLSTYYYYASGRLERELLLAAVIDIATSLALGAQMSNWIAAQLMPMYEEAKADASDENMEELEGLVKKFVSL